MNKTFIGMESVRCTLGGLLQDNASMIRCVEDERRFSNAETPRGRCLNASWISEIRGIWVLIFIASLGLTGGVNAQMISDLRQPINNFEVKDSAGDDTRTPESTAIVLVEGMLEGGKSDHLEMTDVIVDTRVINSLDASANLLSDDGIVPSNSDTLAEIIQSNGAEDKSAVVKSVEANPVEPEYPAVASPSVIKKPAVSERRDLLEQRPETTESPSIIADESPYDDGDVTLVAQAPLIDEPLGSGLATPLVSRGGAPPPPVLLQRLPPPNKTQDVYEIVPEKAQNPVSPQNPVNTQSPETAQDSVGLQENLPLPESIDRPEVPNEPVYILPSDEADQDSEMVWLTDQAPNPKTVKSSRRHRLMKRMGRYMEPMRPLNLCDRGLYFATEFTFLSSSQIAKSQVEVADLLSDEDQLIQSKGAFGYGQRAILGLQGSVFGFEAVYWDYGSRGFESGSWKPPYIFEQYTIGQSVDLSTLDLEITQKFCVAGVNWGTALGLRKMEYVGHSSAFSLATYHDQKVEVSSSALAKNRLDGIGPTFAIRGRKAISRFCDAGNYGTGLFWDTRLSWLWSDSSSSAITEASAVSPTYDSPTVARSLDYAYTISNDPKLRMNFGLQYGAECWRAVGRRSRLVTRAAFEYQYFEQSDDYSMASSFAFLTNDFDFGAATGAIAENSGKDLNMFGFTLMIGINY